MKRLYRSETNKIFAGVMGGFGEYAEIDPVAIRAVYVLLTIFTGIVPGIVAYFVLMLVVPKRNSKEPMHVKSEDVSSEKAGINNANENTNQ